MRPVTANQSHNQLLTRANKVQAAAADHDVERLRREVGGLVDAFLEHAEEERERLGRLPTFTAGLIRRGQERVLDQLIALSAETDDLEEPCQCEHLGADVIVRLTVQADAERRAFARAGVVVDFPEVG